MDRVVSVYDFGATSKRGTTNRFLINGGDYYINDRDLFYWGREYRTEDTEAVLDYTVKRNSDGLVYGFWKKEVKVVSGRFEGFAKRDIKVILISDIENHYNLLLKKEKEYLQRIATDPSITDSKIHVWHADGTRRGKMLDKLPPIRYFYGIKENEGAKCIKDSQMSSPLYRDVPVHLYTTDDPWNKGVLNWAYYNTEFSDSQRISTLFDIDPDVPCVP